LKTTVYFLRHGKSVYTGALPDLTEEGVRQAAVAAQKIEADGPLGTTQVLYSPQPRAVGTAHIIATMLNVDVENMESVHELRCTDFFTKAGVALPWPIYPDEESLERAYMEHPRFDIGHDFERRCDVRARFFEWFRLLCWQYKMRRVPQTLIVVSHFEMLYNLLGNFPRGATLGNAELIKVELMHSRGEEIDIATTFRDMRHVVNCESPFHKLREKFGH
jgi:broad specificity phosphatase PhoE